MRYPLRMEPVMFLSRIFHVVAWATVLLGDDVVTGDLPTWLHGSVSAWKFPTHGFKTEYFPCPETHAGLHVKCPVQKQLKEVY